jgi:glutamate---cysteine ligase / carboxylate-amine ligase
VIQANFGSRPPLTLGIEEELITLDATSLAQVPAVDTVLAGVEGLELPGCVKTELHASVFETNTDPCATAGEALAALVRLRRISADAAGAAGLAIAATGSHPFAKPEAQAIVKEERYVSMVALHGLAARRQNVQGLHVHLAMPDKDSCWRALEGTLPWLPVVLALSANSPWLAGELTGMASNRASILVELPRTGCPPAFGSYDGWEAWVERLQRIGVLSDYTRIWWDVRPQPKLGTLEIRMPDQPTDVRRSGAFAALLQALAATLLEGEVREADRGDYEHNRWTAARFGPEATLIAPGGERAAPAAELAAELFELVRPAAERLGSADLLDLLDPSTCEAYAQLRFPDPVEATADLVRRSLA